MLDVYSVAWATSALVCMIIGVASWRRRPAPGALGLALLSFAQFAWSSLYALQWTFTDHQASLPWLVARLVALQVTPTATLVLVLDLTGRGKWLTKRRLALLLAQPLIVLGFAATDSLHGLYLGGVEPMMAINGGGPVLWANMAYSYALNLLCAGLLLTRLFTMVAYRKQTAVMLVAIMLPVAHFVAQMAGLELLPHVNTVPFTFTISGLLEWYALTQLGLFKVVPVARDRLIEQMSDGIIVLDSAGRVADVNPAALRFLKPSAECLGKTADAAFPKHSELIAQLRAGLAVGHARPTIRTEFDDGSVVDTTASLVLSRDGERLATLVTLRDVTRQARATAAFEAQRDALSAVRERSSRILTAMHDGVLLLDDGGRVLQHNPAAGQILGAEPSSLDGAVIDELAPGIGVADLARQALESGHPACAPVDMQDGRSLIVEVIPLEQAESRQPQALLILRDETGRRAAERMQRDFVANVAHELQTPLTGLSLLADTIPRAMVEDPERARGFVERLSVETQRLVRMTSSLVALSSVERSDGVTRLEQVDLAQLVAEEAAALRHVAEARRQTVLLDTSPDLFWEGSEVDLRAIVRNLLENALCYSGEDGTISVRVGESESDEGPSLTLVVSDDGDGIPPEDLERIFERFYRVDKARSRQTGGTGLGLSIVRAAVERHGGSIEVQSTLGRGSAFTVRLPAAATSGSPSQRTASRHRRAVS